MQKMDQQAFTTQLWKEIPKWLNFSLSEGLMGLSRTGRARLRSIWPQNHRSANTCSSSYFHHRLKQRSKRPLYLQHHRRNKTTTMPTQLLAFMVWITGNAMGLERVVIMIHPTQTMQEDNHGSKSVHHHRPTQALRSNRSMQLLVPQM